MDRKTKLLIVAWQLLNKQHENPYVLDMLGQTIYYDGAECDGSCLMDDIEAILWEEDNIEPSEIKLD